jgi:hypothetical protein
VTNAGESARELAAGTSLSLTQQPTDAP